MLEMAPEYIAHTGPIVKRADAAIASAKRFFTGRPCKHGHQSERFVSNQQCIVCSMAHSYRWAAENVERRAEYVSEYQVANKAQLAAKAMAWRAANRGRFDAKAAEWQKANRTSLNAKSAAWKAANIQRYAAARLLWEALRKDEIHANRTALRLANPLRWKCYAENRRARKLASGGVHTPAQIANLAKLQRDRCAGCETSIKAGFEADHITALSKGGSNDIHNIQLLCRKCNRSKHSKDPIVWAQLNGRLL